MSVVLDAGALIAFERADRRAVAIVRRALDRGDRVVVPAGVVAQTWRDGRRQVRLARLLADPVCEIVALDGASARAVGQLLGASRGRDVVDASVVLVARLRRRPVVTSDARDLRRLDVTLELVEI